MLQLGLPHMNVVTKCDIADKDQIERVLDCEGSAMINQLDKQSPPKLKALSQAIGSVLDDYMIVSFVLLDITDEESIEEVMAKTDYIIQYGKFGRLGAALFDLIAD